MKLTKHHGLGNDFLIHLASDPAYNLDSAPCSGSGAGTGGPLAASDIGADHARLWCDRRRGIGADGLMVATAQSTQDRWRMLLWNSDGSRAELSGNGLRCLGQALAMQTGLSRFQVETDAGVRSIVVDDPKPGPQTLTVTATVEMGAVQSMGDGWNRWTDVGLMVDRQLGVDVGNPHLVALVGDPAQVDLEKVGPLVEESFDDGVNLEVVSVTANKVVTMRVWERGAGITQACGSGAVATAFAAHQWGLVDNVVDVTMPGGEVTVELGDQGALLRGPATFIADVEIA